MASNYSSAVGRYIGKLVAAHQYGQLTDRDLLCRFIKHHDEAAFLALLQKHGSMILRVCRRTLHNAHDADDVFQATFLVLLKKASSLRWRDSIAGWLHEVAYRLALKAKSAAIRRDIKECRAAAEASGDPANAVTVREAQAILHEELHELPESLRAPLVLCYLESATQEEAARQLGWSLRTFKRRLERARNVLQVRLTRRGLTISAVLSTGLLAPCPASAGLIQSALKAAVALTADKAPTAISAPVAALVHGALGSMFLAKLKVVAATMIVFSALGTGLVFTYLRPQSVPTVEVTQANQQIRPVVKANARQAQLVGPMKETPSHALDRSGEPLPPGALARFGRARFRHVGAIHAMAYSPNGKLLATASGDRDNTIRVWDTDTGRELRRLRTDDSFGEVYSVAFSPDGKTLACAGHAAFGSLWDIATGKEIGKFGKSWEEISYTVAFAPDGKTLASGGRDSKVHVWDVATAAERACLQGHEQIIWSFAFSPDGRLLATASADKTVRLWDPASAKEVRRLPPFAKEVSSVAFSRDGRKLATGCQDGSVALWDPATSKIFFNARPKDQKSNDLFNRVAFSPDGETVVSGGTGTLWDTATGKEKGRLENHTLWVQTLAFSPDGAKLASENFTRVRFWDPVTGKAIHEDEDHEGAVHAVAFFPDGRTLASGGGDHAIRLWDPASGKPLGKLAGRPHSDACRLAVAPNGKFIAARMVGTLYLWEAATGKRLWVVQRPGDWSRAIAFAPDSATLATSNGIDDRLIRFWDVRSGKELHSFADQGGFDSLAFSPDGRLAAGGWEGNLGKTCLWETAAGKRLHAWVVHREYSSVNSVAFSPDGTLLASPEAESVRLLEVATGKEIVQLKTKHVLVGSLAFSPDGQMLASAGYAGNVELWEVATGQRRKAWESLQGHVGTVVFAPDGRRLATSGSDGVVWDLTGRRSATDGGPAKKLAVEELDQSWALLAAKDAAQAYTGMCSLAANSDDSVAFLKNRLPPAPEINKDRIQTLIINLTSEKFAVRQAAQNELKDLGDQVTDFLQQAIANNPPLELQRRVETLLAAARALRPETLRRVRAIQVLEDIGSKEAQQILERLGGGFPGARETKDARAALKRLAKRI